MIDIPCKETKCILYPVCKYKVVIECSIISTYFNDLLLKEVRNKGEELDMQKLFDSSWAKYIKPYLPRPIAILPSPLAGM